MTATSRCLYFDNGNTAQRLDAAGTSGIEAEDWLQDWNRTATGRGVLSSYYEGNIKTCADKGMRLPTAYETRMTKPIFLPTGDTGVNPTWAGSSDGVPSIGTSSTRTATPVTFYTFNYGNWSDVTPSYYNYYYDLYSVRCVLPDTDIVPGAPTSLSGTSGNAQVALTWTAPSYVGASAITDYVVQYSSDSGSTWTTFADGTSTSTSATVTGLTNGTAYIFQVAATNSAGTGRYSAASSSVTVAPVCSGDCYVDSAATTAGFAQGPSDVTMEYVFANGSSGFKIWRERGGGRVLNSSGHIANGWQNTLNRSGVGWSSSNLLTTTTISGSATTVVSQIAGRVCPGLTTGSGVFVDFSNMVNSVRCLYYDSGNGDQPFNKDTGTEGEDYLMQWNRSSNLVNPDSTKRPLTSYYEGNIKTCSDKGMRLPTAYETTMNQPSSNLPTGDGNSTPTWAGSTNGVPSHSSWTWTASSLPTNGDQYWQWTGTNSQSAGLFFCCTNVQKVRCVLP
ncbi:fibronectin type III domain-containing protein [bacterium]|nr:fibronectin type III domain-containing protein [bacterium]